MSVRVMTAVWELDLPDSDKIVLLALADCANDEGHCWPSVRSLVAKCSKTDRTVQASIKRLVDAGHLTRREVLGKGCNYTVHPGKNDAPVMFHYVYRTENPATGEFYVGARSCYCPIADDAYLGSGEWVKKQIAAGIALRKTVVEAYQNRDALAHGEKAHTEAVFGQLLCKNRKIATPETLTGRNDFAPKGTTQTPEAASDKPSRTINSEAKASSLRVVAAWNEMAKRCGFTQTKGLDASAEQRLRLRLKERGEVVILKAIENAGKSSWLRGKGRDSNWKPDIDLILVPAKLRKLIDGSYGQDEPATADWSPERMAAYRAKLESDPQSVGSVAKKILEGVRTQ